MSIMCASAFGDFEGVNMKRKVEEVQRITYTIIEAEERTPLVNAAKEKSP